MPVRVGCIYWNRQTRPTPHVATARLHFGPSGLDGRGGPPPPGVSQSYPVWDAAVDLPNSCCAQININIFKRPVKRCHVASANAHVTSENENISFPIRSSIAAAATSTSEYPSGGHATAEAESDYPPLTGSDYLLDPPVILPVRFVANCARVYRLQLS